MNLLETLIKRVSKNPNQFAELVGVSYPRLFVQIRSDKSTYYALKYARELGINDLEGIDNGMIVKIEMKKE